jgi:hypothetical protein
MARAAQSRENFFDFLKPTNYSAALGSTYASDRERKKRLADQKRQKNRDALEDRRAAIQDKKLKAQERAADQKIAAAERKIDSAEKKIDTAEKKVSKGALTEAGFAAIKARMEREIESQERHKKAVMAKNPSFGFGVYTKGGFFGGENQLKHFKSKAAAETWARSTGLKSYSIKRAFAKNPAVSAAQYRMAQAVLSGKSKRIPHKVAQELVDRTPAKLRSEFMKPNSKRKNCKKRSKRNPAEDAAALSEKFHGRPSTSQRTIVEKLHVHKHLMEIGDLVRLVIDTPTGLVAVLNFNTSDPKKIVRLASSERDPKTGKLVGKQLYFRGGDQEVNLAGLKMDSPLWIRDLMELGRLHEFKRGDPKLIVNGEEVKGSITYRTRKGMDDFKLVDYWHKAGEETARKAGPAARSIVLYDYPNKKLLLGGGQYRVEAPGIIN